MNVGQGLETMGPSVRATGRTAGLCAVLAGALFLSACAGGGVRPTSGGFKVGNPYQINGTWYYPREDPAYNETGIASWYGAQFHGRTTANGERFDMNLMSAAHPTLPMPSHVRVTNLNNGRSLIVRVNDRGPFARGRIIDLSRAAARELGFERDGTAPVRVQNLGVAPLNVTSTEARGILEGRRMELAAAQSASVTATTITPPGAGGTPSTSTRPVTAEPARNVNGGASHGNNRDPQRPPRLFVQVGAFGQESNALNLLNRLSLGAQIANAAVEPAWVNGQQLYRVRLGPYWDVGEADQALQRVAGLGYGAARIIVD